LVLYFAVWYIFRVLVCLDKEKSGSHALLLRPPPYIFFIIPFRVAANPFGQKQIDLIFKQTNKKTLLKADAVGRRRHHFR
jgi:hypothetical protein